MKEVKENTSLTNDELGAAIVTGDIEKLDFGPQVWTPERIILLWRCSCGYYMISAHALKRIQRNISEGSRKVPLRSRSAVCPNCGKKEHRINSTVSTSVIAAVSSRKPSQVRNLRAAAEGLNMLLADGEPATKVTFNDMWFQMNRHLRRGKGKRYWCQPIKRWKRLQEGE